MIEISNINKKYSFCIAILPSVLDKGVIWPLKIKLSSDEIPMLNFITNQNEIKEPESPGINRDRDYLTIEKQIYYT